MYIYHKPSSCQHFMLYKNLVTALKINCQSGSSYQIVLHHNKTLQIASKRDRSKTRQTPCSVEIFCDLTLLAESFNVQSLEIRNMWSVGLYIYLSGLVVAQSGTLSIMIVKDIATTIVSYRNGAHGFLINISERNCTYQIVVPIRVTRS